MDIKQYNNTTSKLLEVFENINGRSEWNVKYDTNRIYFTRGKKDWIELNTTNQNLTVYKHSSPECKEMKDKMQQFIYFTQNEIL